MATMSKQKTHLTADQKALIAFLESEDFLANDVYASGKPLTTERMRELGWPVTLEEAMAVMQENKRTQEEAERKSSKRKTA
jgi:hypothetical protein